MLKEDHGVHHGHHGIVEVEMKLEARVRVAEVFSALEVAVQVIQNQKDPCFLVPPHPHLPLHFLQVEVVAVVIVQSQGQEEWEEGDENINNNINE